MESKPARLTEGPVGRHLVDMTVPMLFGIFTLMMQMFADTYFIGQVGDRALAALSFAFPILMVTTSVAIGLGAGTSSVVARAIGAHDLRRARRLATDSLLLCFLITAAICAVGVATIGPLFRAMGAPEDMIPLIAGYMKIFYSAVPFVVVGMVGMSSMRATGDTRVPGVLMVMAAIANVILDPILIFGIGPVPRMELNGAAMAALTSRTALFIGAIILMHRRDRLLSFKMPHASEIRNSWSDILHVGLPAAGTNVIIPIATGVITAMIARYGPDAVAGFGVASRIESVTLVVFYAMSSIIGPFVGQNLSAGKAERIFLALRLCTVFCLSFGLLIAALLAMGSNWLPSLFSDNPDVTAVSAVYLWIAPVSYGAYGMVMVMNASFNGMGKPMPAVVVSVARMAVIYIPLALVGDLLFGVSGIFAAYAIANVATGFFAYTWARRTVEEQCEKHATPVVVTEAI
ncbi:MAG: MATE family efflux transporter [Woeseia sp.]